MKLVILWHAKIHGLVSSCKIPSSQAKCSNSIFYKETNLCRDVKSICLDNCLQFLHIYWCRILHVNRPLYPTSNGLLGLHQLLEVSRIFPQTNSGQVYPNDIEHYTTGLTYHCWVTWGPQKGITSYEAVHCRGYQTMTSN